MFFGKLLRKLRKRRPDIFMRKKKPMSGRISLPGLFGGLGSINLDKIRKLKAQRMGLPDPADFDSNQLPSPDPGASSDIMPKDGLLPKQPPELGTAPNMQRGNAALLPPDFMMLPKPFMGMNRGMPNFLSSGQPPKMFFGMSEGGKVPNKGIQALLDSGPKGKAAVKKMYPQGFNLGGAAGGPGVGFDRAIDMIEKSIGTKLTRDEMRFARELFFDGRTAGEIIKRVKDMHYKVAVPLKYEDLDDKISRVSKEKGLGGEADRIVRSRAKQGLGPLANKPARALTEAARYAMATIPALGPSRLGRAVSGFVSPSMLQKAGGLAARLSAPLAAGAGVLSLLNYMDELENPEMETITYTPAEFEALRQELNPPIIDMNASGDFSAELQRTPVVTDIDPPMEPMPERMNDMSPEEIDVLIELLKEQRDMADSERFLNETSIVDDVMDDDASIMPFGGALE